MENKSMTEKTAREKSCPFKDDVNYSDTMCIASNCMGWVQAESELKREDHSNGKEMIFKEGRKNGRTPIRTGPSSSTGYWILPALGYCAKIHNDETILELSKRIDDLEKGEVIFKD